MRRLPDSQNHRGTATVTNYTILLDLDPELDYLARRMFPAAKGKEQKGGPAKGRTLLEMPSDLDSVRLLRMLADEFGIAIRDPVDRWPQLLKDVKARSDLDDQVMMLGRATPPKARFRGELRPFQESGLDWLGKMEGRGLLADEMGLGKTVQALAFLASRWQTAFPCVVVAPLVTLINWEREIRKFLRGAAPAAGNQALLDASMPDEAQSVATRIVRKRSGAFGAADVYLLNYEIAQARAKELAAARPATVIFDEVQNLRNAGTDKYRGCKEIAKSARYRIGLSGTPLYNRGTEILPIAGILRPGALPEHAAFVGQYCRRSYGGMYDYDVTRPEAQPALSTMLRKRLMLRRRKSEVLADLPAKTRIREEIEIDDAAYDAVVGSLEERIRAARERVSAAKEFGQTDGERAGLLELRSDMAKLRAEERGAAGIAKAPFVARYLTDLLENNPDDKFVVFCHHRAVHDHLLQALKGHGLVQIIGGQSASDRQSSIDRFQTPHSTWPRIAICGLRAGGVGISLTAASYVVFAELDWSPAVHRQAEDRLHRIGQPSAVFAHYLVGSGTFDEQLVEALVGKAAEIDGVLSDKPETVLDDDTAAALLAKRFGRRGIRDSASSPDASLDGTLTESGWAAEQQAAERREIAEAISQ